MIEVEILVELISDLETARNAMSKFTYEGAKKTIDYYYYDPLRANLKLDTNGKLMECCRLREKSGKFYMTYKVDHYQEGIWHYSDEYETIVDDLDAARKIFKALGLQPLVTVDNIKHTYITDKYEIVIEEVAGLGNFLEVEFIDSIAANIGEVKAGIYEFIQSLGLEVGEELNSGKPELLLTKGLA